MDNYLTYVLSSFLCSHVKRMASSIIKLKTFEGEEYLNLMVFQKKLRTLNSSIHTVFLSLHLYHIYAVGGAVHNWNCNLSHAKTSLIADSSKHFDYRLQRIEQKHLI